MRAIAVTSIASQDSVGIQRLFSLAEICSAHLVIIGDKKTPHWNTSNLPAFVEFYSVDDQFKRWPRISNLLPFNHYARKNLAYLWAIENQVEILLDTDDDNYSERDIFQVDFTTYRKLGTDQKWINVYPLFGQSKLWPRGLPLDEVKLLDFLVDLNYGLPMWHCVQSIVDGDPDLDAIGRMMFPEVAHFDDSPPVLLSGEQFCPTNSQATLWKSELFPYLYLPVTAPFRMTDIWRGILVSVVMAEKGMGTLFGKLNVIQNRNPHSLIEDFKDEILGHVYNKFILKMGNLIWSQDGDLSDQERFIRIYEALVKEGILGNADLECIKTYLSWS